jgi:hypothetical protein
MTKKLILLSTLLLFSLGLFSAAHALTINLNQSNVDLGITGDFLTAQVDIDVNGTASFSVEANRALLNPNNETNFGIDNFAFNSSVDITEDQFDFGSDSWGVTVNPNRSISIFGNFDYWTSGTGSTRMNPLEFSITGLSGYNDEIFNVQNDDGYTMAAHVGAIGPFEGQTSAWFSDGGSPPAPVPEPATILLVGSGVIGMAGFCRRKIRKQST